MPRDFKQRPTVNGSDIALLSEVGGAGGDTNPKAIKDPVRLVYNVPTIAGTVAYNATGGTSGRGQITSAPSTVDGVALAAGDRILVAFAGTSYSAAHPGIYTVTTVGSGANGVWDRAADADANGDIDSGTIVYVRAGLLHPFTLWRQTLVITNLGGGSGSAQIWEIHNPEWDYHIIKTADQSVTNSAALVNDTELTKFALPNGAVWIAQFDIVYFGTSATADFKFDVGYGGSTTGLIRYYGTDTTADAINLSTGIRFAGLSDSADLTAGTDAASTPRFMRVEVMARTPSAIAGVGAAFRFAQNTATASQSVTVKAGSSMRLRRVA